MYLGIDLGTTNSVISRSFVDRNNNLETKIIPIGQLNNENNWEPYTSVPSMVYFSEEGRIVGREAKRLRYQDSEHVVTNAKRFMGTSHTWTINGEFFDAKKLPPLFCNTVKRN